MIDNLPGGQYLSAEAGHQNYEFSRDEWAAVNEDRQRWIEASKVLKPVFRARRMKNTELVQKERDRVKAWIARCPEHKREDMRRRINEINSKSRA